MTAKEARNETLWNGVPIDIRKRITDAIKHIVFYHEPYKITIYKSITPYAFIGIEETLLKLKCLGYGAEYIDGTDSKLIISW